MHRVLFNMVATVHPTSLSVSFETNHDWQLALPLVNFHTPPMLMREAGLTYKQPHAMMALL